MLSDRLGTGMDGLRLASSVHDKRPEHLHHRRLRQEPGHADERPAKFSFNLTISGELLTRFASSSSRRESSKHDGRLVNVPICRHRGGVLVAVPEG